MSNAYNLTVQLNLQGPSNLSSIVNSINQQLGNINANVNVNIPTSTTQQIAQVNNNLQQCAQAATRATTTMESFGRAAGLAVRRFAAFTTATAGFYAITRATQQSLGKFIEFDKQITRIAQVTGTTKQSLSGLSEEITRLSVSLGASSSELAKVAVTLSQAGLSASDTQKALKALALTNLAPTFSDMNQTVEGSIALMKQFSISTSQLEKALGSINAVAGGFAVEASDLITAIQRTGGVFASASQGVSQGTDALNEFLAVFTSVRATTRESAETIATGLRTIFTRLQREDTIGALEAFGVKLTDLEGKFVGPYKAVEQLAKGLSQLDPRSLEFSGIVEELGGFRQVGKVIPLIQRFATAQQALNVAQQGSGSLAQSAAVGQQSLAVQISKVKEEFDALIRSIGQTGEFQQFIRLSLDLASALIQVADAIKPVLPAIAALGAARIAGGIAGFARGFRGGVGGGAPGFATGGLVPGSGNSDTFRANLTPGEYVIRKKAVNAIGVSNLDRMNRYASGGPVSPDSMGSGQIRSRIVRTGKAEEYQAGKKINAGDRIHLDIQSIAFDGGNVGNTQFEKRVAASLGGRWVGANNNPIDVVAPGYGPIEVRNRSRLTPPGELADKLARYKLSTQGDSALMNQMQNDNINLGRIYVAYNTGKLPKEELDKKILAGKEIRGLDKLPKGSGKAGYDFTKLKRKANGGSISGQDTVPALLTPGEYVLNADAASAIGEKRLNQLNNADRIGYNSGGAVGRVRFAGGGGVGFGTLFAIQSAVSGLQMAFDNTTKSGLQASNALQGFGTGLMGAIVALDGLKMLGGLKQTGAVQALKGVPGIGKVLTGLNSQLMKFGGAIGIGVAAASAIGMAIVNYKNAVNELEKKLANEKLTSSMDNVSKSLDDIAKGTAGSIQVFNDNMLNAAQASQQLTEAQNQYKYSLIGSTLDYFVGADDQTDTTRSRILADEGMSAYWKSLFDPEMVRDKQEQYAAQDRQEQAKRSEDIVKAQMQRGSQIVQRGGSLADVANAIPMKIREAMAKSNVDVAKQLDRTSDAGQRERIINQEVSRQIQTSLGPEIAQRAAAAANVVAQQLQVALERVFSSMKQGFEAATIFIESRFSKISDNLAASMGQTKIGYDNSALTNILDNPRAFSDSQIKSAISSTMPILGPSGGRVGQLALASTRIEDEINNIIDSVIGAGGPAGAQLGSIGTELINLISGMNLGTDIERVISEQLQGAFDQARKELGDNADPGMIKQRVDEIVKNLPALNGALDVVKQAMSSFGSAQNKYSQAVQQVTDAVLKQGEYLSRVSKIGRESQMQLTKTLGGQISLDDIIGNVFTDVMEQSGGLINPSDLYNQQQMLLAERERINTRRNEISGRADRSQEFMVLSNDLIALDTQLSRNRSALEMLANSTEIAGAALDEYSRIQQTAQEKASFAEKVVTASPREYQDMLSDFSAIQNIIDGGQLTMGNSYMAQRAMMETAARGGNPLQVMEAGQGGFSQQMGQMLSIFKELKPFFGDTQTFKEQYVTLMRSMLNSQGRNHPLFEKMFQEMLGQTDEQQRALQVYQTATAVQQQANLALGMMIDPMGALAQANQTLADAVMFFARTLGGAPVGGGNQRQMNGIGQFARGGVVYAKEGTLVNMEPRGTDTIPAMLTPGEFVVNAKSTKKHRGLLEKINAGGHSTSQAGVEYAANGGIMGLANQRFNQYLQAHQQQMQMMGMPPNPATVEMLRQQAWNEVALPMMQMQAYQQGQQANQNQQNMQRGNSVAERAKQQRAEKARVKEERKQKRIEQRKQEQADTQFQRYQEGGGKRNRAEFDHYAETGEWITIPTEQETRISTIAGTAPSNKSWEEEINQGYDNRQYSQLSFRTIVNPDGSITRISDRGDVERVAHAGSLARTQQLQQRANQAHERARLQRAEEAQQQAQSEQTIESNRIYRGNEGPDPSHWINSSNWLLRGMGYLGGVTEGVGAAAYGVANVAAGGIGTVIGAGVGGVESVFGTGSNYGGSIRQTSLEAMGQGAYTIGQGAMTLTGYGTIQSGRETALAAGDRRRVEQAGSWGGITRGAQMVGYGASQLVGPTGMAGTLMVRAGRGMQVVGRAGNFMGTLGGMPGQLGTGLSRASTLGLGYIPFVRNVGRGMANVAGRSGRYMGQQMPTLSRWGSNAMSRIPGTRLMRGRGAAGGGGARGAGGAGGAGRYHPSSSPHTGQMFGTQYHPNMNMPRLQGYYGGSKNAANAPFYARGYGGEDAYGLATGRGYGTYNVNGRKITYNNYGSAYGYQNITHTPEQLERMAAPYAQRYLDWMQQNGTPFYRRPKTGARSWRGYSRGGIVQPAYLFGGGIPWQFEDLASGYWTYQALNTDMANAENAYHAISKYASPREMSYNRIKYQGGDLGIDSTQAAAKGFGYDAAGRPVFESRYGYSDPRSDLRDERNIFGMDRYPGYMAIGGLARGTDKYPAMLSRGEMVMNAEATKNYQGILRSMNKSRGGIVRNGILYASDGTDGPIGMSTMPVMSSSGGKFPDLSAAISVFTEVVNSFLPGIDTFKESSNSMSAGFGVFNDGVTLMQQTVGLLNNAANSFATPISNFGQSIQDFVSKTANLISAISNIGEVNGTIRVTGKIDFSPITVQLSGGEALAALGPAVQASVMRNIAYALENDNPGINIQSISTP